MDVTSNNVPALPGRSAQANARGGAPALLDMRDITKDFPGGRVLHDVDFRLMRGEVHALVGENGAGKSTLMKILAGLYPDHGGVIELEGDVVSMRSPRAALAAGVAVIYQEFALAPDLTVAENIALGREPGTGAPGSISHRALRARSAKEATDLGIDLPMDTPVGELGVADQQLTEIVKAVARQARVLVMDEPTARLSSKERDRLFGIIRGLSARGVGVIYISHFLEEIFSVASRVTVLRDGHLVACDTLDNLDLPQLARLMVGDKFREIEISTRQNLEGAEGERVVALKVDDLSVDDLVKPVSFTLHRGEVIGFAGLQGSGRTEMVDAIVGNRPARRGGRLHIGSYSGLPRHPRAALAAGILMLPAARKTQGILAVRSVAENIAIAALDRDLSIGGFIRAKKRRLLVEQMIDRFAVRPKAAGVEISSLSGGNQQKALFARATAAEAAVLILDQPTAGVDVGATVELYDQIDLLTSSGVAVLLVSDDLTELLRLSDTIILMKDGLASAPKPVSSFDRASLLASITGKAPEISDRLGGEKQK